MRMSRRSAGVAIGLAAVLVLGGCGDDEDSASSTTTVAPTTSTTLSQAQLDKQKAQRIVLTAADVPGYTVDPPDPSDESSAEFVAAANACANNNAAFTQLGEDTDPRGASSPDFSKDDTLTVSSDVTFTDTDDQARTAIADVSTASFPTCLARAVAAELKKDTSLTNVTATTTKRPAITAGDQNVSYRTVMRFRTQGTNVTVNADTVFIRVGRAVASLDVSSVTTAFPDAEKLRLATLLAGRMTAP